MVQDLSNGIKTTEMEVVGHSLCFKTSIQFA